jgi:hypothetical protein
MIGDWGGRAYCDTGSGGDQCPKGGLNGGHGEAEGV